MSTTIQTVTLSSHDQFGRRVPPQEFGELLRALPEAVRYSIRMAFEGRSRALGKRPDWLVAASDIRFLDHEGSGETVVHFEVPRLGDAAEILYRQQEMWPTRPNPSDTGFDLLGDVISDIAAADSDSERFDRHLLQRMERFRHAIDGCFQTVAFTGTRHIAKPAVITPLVIETARQLSHDTPQSQQTRLVGKLDMIRASTNSFALKLHDGQEVRGALTEGSIAESTRLFEHEVVVFGKAVYRPSGRLLRIDADEVVEASERDQFFTMIPKPKWARYDLRKVLREQQDKKGVAAIFGKWPGEETDEEIERALREIS